MIHCVGTKAGLLDRYPLEQVTFPALWELQVASPNSPGAALEASRGHGPRYFLGVDIDENEDYIKHLEHHLSLL